MDGIGLTIFGGIGLLVVGSVAIAMWSVKKRTEAWQLGSGELGLGGGFGGSGVGGGGGGGGLEVVGKSCP